MRERSASPASEVFQVLRFGWLQSLHEPPALELGLLVSRNSRGDWHVRVERRFRRRPVDEDSKHHGRRGDRRSARRCGARSSCVLESHLRRTGNAVSTGGRDLGDRRGSRHRHSIPRQPGPLLQPVADDAGEPGARSRRPGHCFIERELHFLHRTSRRPCRHCDQERQHVTADTAECREKRHRA